LNLAQVQRPKGKFRSPLIALTLIFSIAAPAVMLAQTGASDLRRTTKPTSTRTPKPTRTPTPTPTPVPFANPERVIILGYSDNAGNNNFAIGQSSVAIGDSATAVGPGAIALGQNATAEFGTATALA
jgi:hypothetical protein